MKKIIIGLSEIIISDEEAQKLKDIVKTAKFVTLRSGEFINVEKISCIVDFKGIPYFEGNKVYEANNGSMYTILNGKKDILSDNHIAKIQYITPDREKKHIEKRAYFIETDSNNREIQYEILRDKEKEFEILIKEENDRVTSLWKNTKVEDKIDMLDKKIYELQLKKDENMKDFNRFTAHFLQNEIEKIFMKKEEIEKKGDCEPLEEWLSQNRKTIEKEELTKEELIKIASQDERYISFDKWKKSHVSLLK